jgi:hypothetical protein
MLAGGWRDANDSADGPAAEAAMKATRSAPEAHNSGDQNYTSEAIPAEAALARS